jgi:hypothetical protein
VHVMKEVRQVMEVMARTKFRQLSTVCDPVPMTAVIYCNAYNFPKNSICSGKKSGRNIFHLL